MRDGVKVGARAGRRADSGVRVAVGVPARVVRSRRVEDQPPTYESQCA
jgi:acetyltransferase-like isoleucine patch superfamily enzyme